MEFRRVLFRSVRPAGAAAAAGRLAGRHDPLPERRRAVRRLALPPRPDACDVLPRGDVPADRRAARLALRVSGRGRRPAAPLRRSEEHTSELQSLMRISYAVFCLKKKTSTCNNTLQLHVDRY